MKLLEVGGLLAIGYVALTATKNAIVNSYEFLAPTAKYLNSESNLINYVIEVKWPIRNNGSLTLKLERFEASIFYGPHRLADVNFPQAQSIASGQTTAIISKIRVGAVQIGTEIISAVQRGQLPLYTLQLVGSCVVNGITVRIDQPIKLAN